MNKERLNPHFNINAKYEAMIRDSKEIVKHYLSKESNGEPTEGVCLAYDVKNYLPSLLEENNQLKERITYLERSCERKEETIKNERDENIELSNKIDKAIEYLINPPKKIWEGHSIDEVVRILKGDVND